MSEVGGSTTKQLVVDWAQEDMGTTAEAPLLMTDPSLGSSLCKTGCNELQPIGARRKGRRKGCKNRPPIQRHQQAEAKKKSKNAKERKRVQNIHHEYTLLRELLGDRNEKLSKLQVLNATIEYIKHLSGKLRESEDCSSVACTPGPPPALPLPSISQSDTMPSDFSFSPFSITSSTENSSSPVESSCGHHLQYCADSGSHTMFGLTSSESYAEVVPCQSPQFVHPCQSPQLVHVPALELMVTVQPAAGSPWLISPSRSVPPPLSHFSYQ